MRSLITLFIGVLIVVGGYVFLNQERHRQELQPVYEDYLAAKALALATFDPSLLAEITTEPWFTALNEDISVRKENDIIDREYWKSLSVRVLEYSESHAEIRVAGKYLNLGRDGSIEDYPEYYWHTRTEDCEFVRVYGSWRVSLCRNVVPDW